MPWADGVGLGVGESSCGGSGVKVGPLSGVSWAGAKGGSNPGDVSVGGGRNLFAAAVAVFSAGEIGVGVAVAVGGSVEVSVGRGEGNRVGGASVASGVETGREPVDSASVVGVWDAAPEGASVVLAGETGLFGDRNCERAPAPPG
jgi:hypothetical protein